VPDGVATGFGMVELLSVPDGDHAYVPPPVALSVVLVPPQMLAGDPALATGRGSTITLTVSVALHPACVPVTVYKVVLPGFAVGFAIVELLSPADGDQE
jgi:hypothetical protein